MLLALYLLTLGVDGWICRTLMRRGEWRNGFFFYRMWALRSVLLLPTFFDQPVATYAAMYWPMKAIELGVIGWTLGAMLERPVLGIGAAPGLLVGIAMLQASCPYDVYRFAVCGIAIAAAFATWKTRSLIPAGIGLIAVTNAVVMNMDYGRDWVPVVGGLLAQVLWCAEMNDYSVVTRLISRPTVS